MAVLSNNPIANWEKTAARNQKVICFYQKMYLFQSGGKEPTKPKKAALDR